jgi:hypothetical protein
MPRTGQLKAKLTRRGRTALLWGLAVFLALQGGLAVAIERWLPEFRDPEYAYRMARLYRRTVHVAPRPLTVVMLGSSRTTLGFESNELEAYLSGVLRRPVVVFNFGITGAGPVMQLVDLRRLLARHIHPDLLLVEVMPPLLAGQVAHETMRTSAARLWRPELKTFARYGAPAPVIRRTWWETFLVPWYGQRFCIISRVAPACLPYQSRMDWAYTLDDSGWVKSPVSRGTPERYRQSVENARREYGGYFVNFKIKGPSTGALRELLDQCRSAEVPAALVLMPEGSEFRSLYVPAVWAQMQSFLDQLSHEYAAPVINAREWIGDDDFSDSHHLLPHGASQFTQRLGQERLLPMLKARLDAPSSR